MRLTENGSQLNPNQILMVLVVNGSFGSWLRENVLAVAEPGETRLNNAEAGSI